MGPNIDFDTLWDQIIDKQLEDNTKEEIIRLILESQQEVDNTNRRKQRRKVVNQDREEGHD